MITPRIGGIGGVAQHVRKLVELLRRDGHEVYTISTENVFHIRIKNLINPSFAVSSTVSALVNRLRGLEFDIVHAHNPPSAISMLISRSRGKVLTMHGIYAKSLGLLHGGMVGRFSTILEVLVGREVDAVTCVSRSVTEYYRSLGAPALYIPNAIDFDDLPSQSVRLYDPQVVFVGRLSKEKGVDILLKAFINLDAHLLIIGSGPLEGLVKHYVVRHPNIHYLGYLPREEALKYVKGSDLLVLPSRIEGLPTVLLEAMALRVPIVASKIPEILEVVDDSTATLVEPEDHVALAEAIKNSLKSYSKEKVEKAYIKCYNLFNWKITYKKYIKLYKYILTH